MRGASAVTKSTTMPSMAMFRRASSAGPENRLAIWLIPAVSTLISGVEHITTSKMNAVRLSAAMWSRRWVLVRLRIVGQRAQ
jgi:hypothetical protein